MSSEFLRRLEGAHQWICWQIDLESRLQQPDHLRLAKLKKLRLSVKDRMARVKARAIVA